MDRQRLYDELLVIRAAQGDRQALATLVARWHERLWRHARRLLGDSDAAWDAVQDAWVAIAAGLRKLADPRRFAPWAYRILTHKCTDALRGRMRRRRLIDAAAALPRDGPPADPGPDHEVRDRLRRAMRALPRDQFITLTLHYVDGFAVAEIAQILEIPDGTVKSRLHHAREQLKRRLGASEEMP
jgi:RNA polymerase sigma-70 factor (ECF subfamily)